MTDQAAAGWYRHDDQARYWDGAAWTDRYRPLPASLPPAAPAAPPPVPGSVVAEAADNPAKGARTAAMVIGAGTAAVAIGCFLPWLKVTAPLIGTLTKGGVDDGGDGVIALGLAAALAFVAYQSRDGTTTGRLIRAAILIGVLGGLVVYEVNDLSSRFAEIEASSDLVTTSYGSGLVLVGLGVLVTGVGWLQMLGARPSRSSLR